MMKYTLMAIAVKESSVGKNQVNVISNDYGLFQSNIKSVLRGKMSKIICQIEDILLINY